MKNIEDIFAPKEMIPLIHQFLCAVPMKEFDWPDIFDQLVWKKQEVLLRYTVGFHPVLTYPLKVSYQKEFLKSCIERLQRAGIEVHDQFYEHYGRLVALPEQTFAHKHFMSSDGLLVSLKENISFVSEGTTGLCTWQAGIALAEWCNQNSSYLKAKNVIELGSGVGLTGISAILHCIPKKIYLTDCHLSVLRTLWENIKITANLSDLQLKDTPKEHIFDGAAYHTELLYSFVNVVNLPWEKIDQEVVEKIDADLVLAADVVYDKDLFEDLITAVRLFLEHKTTKVVFACTERNLETLELFLNTLQRESLSYETLPLPEQKDYIWSKETPIRIFSISKQ